jgi:hypothetical protein
LGPCGAVFVTRLFPSHPRQGREKNPPKNQTKKREEIKKKKKKRKEKEASDGIDPSHYHLPAYAQHHLPHPHDLRYLPTLPKGSCPAQLVKAQSGSGLRAAGIEIPTARLHPWYLDLGPVPFL